MKRMTFPFKRGISMLLAAVLVLTLIPTSFFVLKTSAAENRKADVSTMDDWKGYFGKDVLNTENAGAVWGDKSVFTSADTFASYGITMNDAQNNFLIALSAMASDKSIVGYSAIPTDTVMVLDLSGSMSSSAVSDMVEATNEAIRTLQNLNYNNRVSVIVYAGSSTEGSATLSESATVLLPLGRYDGVTQNGEKSFISYSTQNKVVSVINGVLDLDRGQRNPSRTVVGSTYIQAGIQLAVNEFNSVSDTTISTGVQKGESRMPVLVLMSDGAPTLATTSYTNVGRSTHGRGTSSSVNETTAFLTQLSCVWAREQMAKKYGEAPLFYTLGLNVDSSTYARAVLDPSTSNQTLLGFWNDYLTARGSILQNQKFTIDINSDVKNFFKVTDPDSGAESYQFSSYVNEYFSASSNTQSGNQLIDAFEEIVDQIIIQSKYYPTLVENGNYDLDGYVSFTDELGEYMEVKDIKGLTVHGAYYKGSVLAKAFSEGEFGDVSLGDPSRLTAEGRQILKAIQTRIGCTEEQALMLAYNAQSNGQLYYNSETDFSNYIGWYGDDEGNFLGFWDGNGTEDKPEGATFVNKSYGFFGEVGTDAQLNLTDMCYISVQVHENIELGHQMILYRIPASLVPMVHYEISFNGETLEEGTDFRMAVTGADEPLRLIYEAGLRSDINAINVTEKVDPRYAYKNQNGYLFYTNAWADHQHSETGVLTSHEATVMDFEPSLENERYYFTKDTLLYDANGNPVTAYDPKTVSGDYYYRFVSFETDTTAMDEARMVETFIEVSAESVALSEYSDLAGGYVIPGGTPHRKFTYSKGPVYRKEKADKTITNTLDYANYSSLVYPANDVDYHITSCLGNNGVLSLTPSQGIALTKTLKYQGLGADQVFTFEITLTGENLASSYPLYNYEGEKLGEAAVSNGKMQVSLKGGETIYIADLPTGTEYSVAELSHPEWKISASSGTAGTVAKYEFASVFFENEPFVSGSLLVYKTVVRPDTTHFADPSNLTFTVDVTFEGETVSSVSVDGNTQPVTDNKLTFHIRHGQTVALSNIPEGVTYTVTERAVNGFVQGGTGLTGTIQSSVNAEARLINTYNPAPAEITFSHEGFKHLSNRDWKDGDTFTFELQYFNGVQWVSKENSTVTVDHTTPEHKFSLDSVLSTYVFDKAGEYLFRVVEKSGEIGGVSYDTAEKRFTVHVGDDNYSGRLKITNVTTTTPNSPNPLSGTQVTHNTENDTYRITTYVNNSYRVDGTAEVFVDVTKVLENLTGLAQQKDGFLFDLYRLDGADEIYVASARSDENGKATITLSISADFLGQTLTYKVKEADEGREGIVYDSAQHTFTVTLYDKLDGTMGVRVNGQDTDTFEVTFNNAYVLSSATATISGNKVLMGRQIDDGEFTFELYRCADGDFSNPVKVSETTNAGNAFTLTESGLTAVGDYYYIVKEKNTGAGGIQYDTSEYCVVVHVAKGDGATLQASVKSIAKNGTAVDDIGFINSYTAQGIDVIIAGDKDLTGRVMNVGEFKFLLKDASGTIIGESTNVDSHGAFSFERIHYTLTDAGTTFTYTVEEDSSAALGGVSYDPTVYTVTVTITDNGDGTLSKSVTYSKDGTPVALPKFINGYTTSSTSVTLSGDKDLNGRGMNVGEFTFLLKDSSGAVIDTVQNTDPDGTFAFASISYTLADAGTTFTYTVVEDSSAALGGVSYDPTVYTVTVTVADNGDGTLSTQVKYETPQGVAQALKFVNTYDTASITHAVLGDKDLNGRTMDAHEFYFLLKDDTGAVIDRVSNLNTDGFFAFAPITYTLADAGKTFTYTVEEDGSAAVKKGGVTYDQTVYVVTVKITDNGDGTLSKQVSLSELNASASEIKFVNAYTAAEISATIQGDKDLDGREMEVGEFTFHLKDASGTVIDTVQNTDTDGTFAFAPISYTLADAGTTFTYTVEEDDTDALGGMDYDQTVYTVTVAVSDNRDGTLSATVTYQVGSEIRNGLKFTNNYTIAGDTYTISGTKVLVNRDLKNGEFTFLLKDASGAVVDDAQNNERGEFSFDAIPCVLGTFVYTVEEELSQRNDRMEYDASVYTVTVKITDNGDGTYKKEISYSESQEPAQGILFTNRYIPKDVAVCFAVTKILENNTQDSVGLDQFKFVLSREGERDVTGTSDEEGKAVFSLTYTAEDIGKTFVYTVTEANTGLAGMTYDTKKVTVTVTITVNGDGELIPLYTVDDVSVDEVSLSFRNVYHKNPHTADHTCLWLWVSLGVSACVTAGVILRKKKEVQEA